MLHDVIILVYIFNVFTKTQQIIRKQLFSIFFPLGGNFDIDAGDGGGAFRTQNLPKSQTISKTQFVRELFTLLGQFSTNVKTNL